MLTAATSNDAYMLTVIWFVSMCRAEDDVLDSLLMAALKVQFWRGAVGHLVDPIGSQTALRLPYNDLHGHLPMVMLIGS